MLTLEASGRAITAFHDTTVFPRFGLPRTVPSNAPGYPGRVIYSPAMGCYGEQVLPRIIDVVLRAEASIRCGSGCANGLEGEVVEIGFGSGLNVPFYPAAVTRVAAIEPADLGWKLAGKRLARATVAVERPVSTASRCRSPTTRFDAALSTWTMCTIPDLDAALRELRRVLKPGGTLHFVEHGLAPDEKVQRWQHRLEPVQQRLFGGCHLTRPIVDLVEPPASRSRRSTSSTKRGAEVLGRRLARHRRVSLAVPRDLHTWPSGPRTHRCSSPAYVPVRIVSPAPARWARLTSSSTSASLPAAQTRRARCVALGYLVVADHPAEPLGGDQHEPRALVQPELKGLRGTVVRRFADRFQAEPVALERKRGPAVGDRRLTSRGENDIGRGSFRRLLGAPRVTAPSPGIHRCASGGTSWEGRRVGIEDALGRAGLILVLAVGLVAVLSRRVRRRRRAGSRPGCRFPARAAGRVSLGDGLGADASSVPCRGARPQRAMGAKPGARHPPVSVPDRRRARPRPRSARQGTDLPSAVWRTLPALRPHGR